MGCGALERDLNPKGQVRPYENLKSHPSQYNILSVIYCNVLSHILSFIVMYGQIYFHLTHLHLDKFDMSSYCPGYSAMKNKSLS